jgi:hypothetical protein
MFTVPVCKDTVALGGLAKCLDTKKKKNINLSNS